MNTMRFEAFINGVHVDPKKGALKIQFFADTRVSVDKLTSLTPQGDLVRITLERPQMNIDVGDPSSRGEDTAEELKDAEERQKPEERGFPLSKDPSQIGDELGEEAHISNWKSPKNGD
jgi:hypothetical protein